MEAVVIECIPIPDGFVCAEKTREVKREPHGEGRWCFHCRKHRAFEYVVSAPVGVSYYGPNVWVECAACHTADGDLFPGRTREWEEE